MARKKQIWNTSFPQGIQSFVKTTVWKKHMYSEIVLRLVLHHRPFQHLLLLWPRHTKPTNTFFGWHHRITCMILGRLMTRNTMHDGDYSNRANSIFGSNASGIQYDFRLRSLWCSISEVKRGIGKNKVNWLQWCYDHRHMVKSNRWDWPLFFYARIRFLLR